MSKQEALFLGSLGVSGFVIGWLESVICGLQYFLMNFMYPTAPILAIVLFLWWRVGGKSTLTCGFIFVLGLGVGASSANFVNPTPQEICERTR